MTPGGLGRGLAALIPPRKVGPPAPATISEVVAGALRAGLPEGGVEPYPHGEHSIVNVPLEKIDRNPQQPRVEFSESELQDLAQSIREHGILQPLLVTKEGDRFVLVVGERRFKAAKRAGLSTVPCLVHGQLTEKERLELAVIENVQRADLNPIEQAVAYKRLHQEFGLTHDEIARVVGKERPTVSNTMRLLDLPEDMQAAVRTGKITMGLAKGLLAAKDPAQRQALFEKLLRGELTKEGIERVTRRVGVKAHSRHLETDPQLALYETELSRALGTRVRIKKIADGGAIDIEYYSPEELSGLVERLTRQ